MREERSNPADVVGVAINGEKRHTCEGRHLFVAAAGTFTPPRPLSPDRLQIS